jgi:cytochrome d ubiquinol oxidase subunit I
VLVLLLALVMHYLKRLEHARWLLWILLACIPLALIAINMGWTSAEVGRQPWIVQGLLRTSDAISPVVSAGEIWTTMGLFAIIYLILFVAWLRIFIGIVRRGPEDVAEMLTADQGAAVPARAGAGR